MSNRAFLLLGIALVFWGILINVRPRFYDPIYRRLLDFTGYEILLGSVLIIVGIYSIWTSLHNLKDRD